MKTKSNVSILSSIVLLSLCSCGQRNVTVHVDTGQKSYDIVLKSGESLTKAEIFNKGWAAEVFCYDDKKGFGPFYKDTYYPYHDGPVTEDIDLVIDRYFATPLRYQVYVVFPQIHWHAYVDCDVFDAYDNSIFKDIFLADQKDQLEAEAPGSSIKSFYWDFDASTLSFVDPVEYSVVTRQNGITNSYTLYCELEGLTL